MCSLSWFPSQGGHARSVAVPAVPETEPRFEFSAPCLPKVAPLLGGASAQTASLSDWPGAAADDRNKAIRLAFSSSCFSACCSWAVDQEM